MKSLPILEKTAIDSGEIVNVSPSQTLDNHVHASTEYMMVLEGELELAMQNPKIGWWYRKICVSGECYEIRPGWVHHVTNLSGERDAMIQRFYE
ncbi:cupin domain-containing protein [Kamptonema animale CS-326]|uniref:cupin domain-containing protein n=1 Tax=Kamptonema animale TaxID=92934 RepID=UPI00232FDB51|nr:cupin domain-containing protein [Kamptonema animale]MDB9513362.1 cupin domain-containing protein [Kamptonema animale CS-326]